MNEMRTEMVYIKYPNPDNPEEYEWCGSDEAEGTGIIFTADHPTELNDEGKPQEYGIMVITDKVLKQISDVEEFVINGAVKALKEAGCLTGETVGTGIEASDEKCLPDVECACKRDD